jgi:hypothetical protein
VFDALLVLLAAPDGFVDFIDGCVAGAGAGVAGAAAGAFDALGAGAAVDVLAPPADGEAVA